MASLSAAKVRLSDTLIITEWCTKVVVPLRLRIEEAVDMLAVDMESDPPQFDEDNRLVDPEEILKMWRSLVRLDTESRSDMGNSGKVRTLTVAHTSVMDFLQTQPIKIGPKKVFRFSRAESNLRMAETCLIYLRYFVENNITLTKDNITSYPFARPCALIWDELYREALASSEGVDVTSLNDMVMELFTSPIATLNWIRLSDPDTITNELDLDLAEYKIKPALYYAAHLGLRDIVERLIRDGGQTDEVIGPPFGTALTAACAMGRTDVVSLLLDSGADPNLSGFFYSGTPLAVSVERGWVEIVKILLGKKGINIHARRHPPVEASEEVIEWAEEYHDLQDQIGEGGNDYENKKRNNRCMEIGAKLIELGENAKIGDWGNDVFRQTYGSNECTNSDFGKQTTAFTDTERKGNTSRSSSDESDQTRYQSFFRRVTAASNRIERSNQSLIFIAAEFNALDTLEILLAASADPNVRGGYFGTALQRVCAYNDNDDVVEMLLKNGARTDLYGGYCGSPLHAACGFGSIRMVEKLILAGADVNRLGKLHLLVV